LPAFGQSAEPINRGRLIGFVTRGKCLIKTESVTQKQYDKINVIYQRQNTELKPAFKLVTLSSNGLPAVKAMTSHFDSNCEHDRSIEETGRLILPYLDWSPSKYYYFY